MTHITLPRAVVEQAADELEKTIVRTEARQATINNLRAALAQQAEQQPMHPELRKMWEDHFDKCFRAIPVPEQAEPVLAPAPGYCKHCKQYTIEEPLPAEPVQEPVAWMVYTEGGTSAYVTDNPNDLVGAYRALPLYTAPPEQAEPVEPVAYIHRQGNHWEVSERHLDEDEKARGWTEEPLYTAPPQRKPLTDEEIEAAAKSVPAAVYELMHGHEITVGRFRAALAEVARAVERAHGIGEGA